MKKFSVALDTCVGSGSFAVFEGEDEVCAFTGFLGRGSDVTPLEILDSALVERRLDIQDLEDLFLTRGPGSFTGVRTGLSIARGLCEAIEPCVRTCTVFEALSTLASENLFLTLVFAGSREVACLLWGQDEDARRFPLSTVHSLVSNSSLEHVVVETGSRMIVAEPRAYGAINTADLERGGIPVICSGDNLAVLARRFILSCQDNLPNRTLEPVYTREFAPGA